jgi:hypothetical protein
MDSLSSLTSQSPQLLQDTSGLKPKLPRRKGCWDLTSLAGALPTLETLPQKSSTVIKFKLDGSLPHMGATSEKVESVAREGISALTPHLNRSHGFYPKPTPKK